MKEEKLAKAETGEETWAETEAVSGSEDMVVDWRLDWIDRNWIELENWSEDWLGAWIGAWIGAWKIFDVSRIKRRIVRIIRKQKYNLT